MVASARAVLGRWLGAGATGAGGASGGGAVGGTGAAAGTGAVAGTGGVAGSGGSPPADPNVDGPSATEATTITVMNATTGNTFSALCHAPAGDGSFPVVLIGHGFQLAATQYESYAKRLASFDYVACSVDFPAGFQPNNVANAQDMLSTLDAVAGNTGLGAKADLERVGAMGHSLGGKVAVLAASMDPRVDAVLGLDPVDGAMFCDPTLCPDASDKLPLPIPTAFLGETLDSTGSLQACAPKADNFETFFAAAASPSVSFDFAGANHMSFIDDPTTCGFACAACRPATAPHADVVAAARAITVAFFERHLRGDLAYEHYLTGDGAQQRYVATGAAQLVTK